MTLDPATQRLRDRLWTEIKAGVARVIIGKRNSPGRTSARRRGTREYPAALLYTGSITDAAGTVWSVVL